MTDIKREPDDDFVDHQVREMIESGAKPGAVLKAVKDAYDLDLDASKVHDHHHLIALLDDDRPRRMAIRQARENVLKAIEEYDHVARRKGLSNVDPARSALTTLLVDWMRRLAEGQQ